MITIIYGPMASGKTRYADKYLRHYGAKRLVDDWDGRRELSDGDLALTTETPPYRANTMRRYAKTRVVDVETAKLAINAI